MTWLAFLLFAVPVGIGLIFLAYWWAISSAEDMGDNE